MASYFDDNDWESIEEEKLRFFYEEFSASIRKQLLSKNLMVPQNVYDVLYPRTRNTLLAKNVVVITDLEQNSKTIRDALIAKLVTDNINLDKISEDTRNSLLARNKIIQDTDDLLNGSFRTRKDLLAKNKTDDGDLLKDSQSTRDNNLARNVDDLSAQAKNDLNTEQFRVNNIVKNVTDNGDLLSDSKDFRNKNIFKNVSDTGDLEKESQSFRDNNLAANKPDNGDLLNDSAATLQKNISANKPDSGDLLTDSETTFKKNLSANVPDTGDLLTDSAATLKKNTSANVPDAGDLLTDSAHTLKNNISANKPDTGDLLNDSAATLQKNISANKHDTGDLLNDSAATLQKNISANKHDTGDLLNDSAHTLKNNISANKPDSGDLLTDSSATLKKNTSANKPDTGDLLTDSAKTLKNNVSANKPDTGDLLTDSATILKNNISANKSDGGDLLKDSANTLQKNISANKPDKGDLLADSTLTLKDNLAPNKPDKGDLLADSAQTLKDNLAPNKPDTGDLLNDSAQTLKDNLAPNKPDKGDLLIDSAQTLKDNLAPNKPDKGDLLIDSATFLKDNLAPNVPDKGDLLSDSTNTLANNLAPNVPDNGDLLKDSAVFLKDNLAPNVPDNGDLLSDSVGIRKDNLIHNIPDNGNLLNDSTPIRNNLISSNVSTAAFSLDSFSKKFRDNNLASNAPIDSLGVVVEGIGTSTFLGISRVLIQGVLLRQILLSRNKNGKYTIDTTADGAKKDLFSKNKFQLNSNEYGTASANLTKLAGNSYHGKITRDEIQSQINAIEFYNRNVAQDLQIKYGTNFGNSFIPASVGGGFFATSTTSRKGGFIDQQNALNQVNFNVAVSQGSITDAIRNYNLSRNLYNLYKLTPGDLASLTTLQNNNDEGFQDLINKTIGHLSGNDSIGSQLQGNLIPRGILVANEGAYIKGGSPETQFRPQQAQGMVIGSPESMMAKTTLGNPLNDTEFQSGAKGVIHIIRTIRNSDASKFSINYDVQNSRKYVIGVNTDGSPKVARQRFTVANPYRPGNAKKVQFYLQNYSSGQAYYFPPYIQDFSDSYGANWNSINFLGRPEPIFTYNNSTRDGSISFVVLTDYAQNLVIGTDFTQDTMSPVTINPKIHFTDQDASQNNQRALAIQQSEANQKLTNQQAAAYTDFQNNDPNSPNKDVLNQTINNLKKDSNSLQQNQEDLSTQSNHGNLYSETNPVIGNVNNYLTSKPGREAGDIDTQTEDTKNRIEQMIKNLAFQPAFFSGDKVDFLTKMDFLAKLTRPAKADEGSGFSFTRPPVCHIHLGDWWSNDIVVDSVNISYADAPWTLDDGRTQPMWATVSMSFKFIGPYRGQQGGPVLSDDVNGFYALRGTPSQSIK